MKKFAQLMIAVVALAGLSACASGEGRYGDRTAGNDRTFAGKTYETSSDALAACQERVRRLEKMNNACYRK